MAAVAARRLGRKLVGFRAGLRSTARRFHAFDL